MSRSLDDLFNVLERIAVATESIANSLENGSISESVRKNNSDLELQALVLLDQQSSSRVNVSEIADRLGVSRHTLYRLPKFSQQLQAVRGDNRSSPAKGYVTTHGIEAIDWRDEHV